MRRSSSNTSDFFRVGYVSDPASGVGLGRWTAGLVLACAGACANSALGVTPKVTYRIVAQGGTPAPGAGADVGFEPLGFDVSPNSSAYQIGPAINASGKVAFRANLQGPGFSGQGAIFSDGSGTLAPVARAGEIAPGTTVPYRSFEQPRISDGGRVAFVGRLDGVATNVEYGVWTNASGPLSLVARAGGLASGAGAGVVFYWFRSLHFNESGRIAFAALLAGANVNLSNDYAIYSNAGGPLSLVAREGSQAPSLSSGVLVNTLTFGNFCFNDAGQVAFLAYLSGTGVTSLNDFAIFRGVSGTVTSAIRKGDPLPGVGTSTAGGFQAGFDMNNAGDLGFVSYVAPNAGAFTGNPGSSLRLSARTGLPAPSAAAGVMTQDLDYPRVNDAGRVVLNGMQSNNLRIIMRETGGEVQLVARETMSAQGTPVGGVFSLLSPAAINRDGRVAFAPRVTYPGITGGVAGVWMTDANGFLRQIVRVGDTFDIDPSPGSTVLRNVEAVTFLNDYNGTSSQLSVNGYHSGLGDNNEIALGVRVAMPDGSERVDLIVVASVSSECPADFDDGTGAGVVDGAVTIEDLVYYLGAFEAGDVDADLENGSDTNTPDGAVTIEDLLYFLTRFETGC